MNTNNDQPENRPYELCIGVLDRSNHCDDATHDAVSNVVEQIETTLQSAMECPSGKTGSPKTFLQRCDTWLAKIARPVLKGFGYEIPVPPRRICGSRQTPVAWKFLFSEQCSNTQNIVDQITENFKNKSSTIHSVTWPGTNVGTSQDPEPHASSLAECWVLDFSEILILIWDGNLEREENIAFIEGALKQGGHIVWINPSATEQSACLLTSLSIPESAGEGLSEFAALEINTSPLPQHAVGWSRRFHCLAAYHRDPAENSDAIKASIVSHTKELRKSAVKAGLSEESIQPLIEKLLPIYARADHLAAVYQRLYMLSAKWLFRFSALAVSIVAAQILFFPDQLWIISFEIAAMLAALGLMRIARNEAWHEKWLNNRHFSEWLRTHLFTSMLKDYQTDQRVVASERLPFYRCPDNWFIDTYRPLIEEVRQEISHDSQLDHLKRYLIDGWIDSQANWHAGNVGRKRGSAHKNHMIGSTLFGATLLMAVLHLWGVGHPDHHSDVQQHAAGIEELAGLGITFLAIILPAWGAAVHAVGNMLEHDRIATRSEHMSRVLKQIVAEAEAANSIDELKHAIAHAEEVMATENHEWLVSLSFRNISSPGF
ncbi:hypothetical protein [uncultured Gimesia sp.]|uniref:hypothetical protein n=1 Tax=uncultured Gimesia sp. TaxID=1678688 RepID=UPI002631AA35|nr:hypothetical protein [uncultured Gimesia sp.]